MEIYQSKMSDGILILSIAGDLDAGSSIEMDRVISEALKNKHYRIFIDCKMLNYISSAGLGVFISHKENVEEKDGSFVFYHMKEKVYNVFELLGLHNIFSIVSNEHDARKLMPYEKN